MNRVVDASDKMKERDPLFSPEGKLETYNEEKLMELFKVSPHIQDVFYEGQRFGPHKIKQKTFTRVWFKRTVFEGVHFQDCVFVDCRLLGVMFRNCEFHDCKFRHCNTHKLGLDGTYIDPKSFTHLPDKRRYANIGVHLFHELYRNSHEMLQPDFKNAAEYEFKKWQRYELAARAERERGHGRKTLRILRKWAGNMAFFLISGYGLKPFRITLWSLGLFCAVVYFNYGFWSQFSFYSPSLDVGHATFPLSVYYTMTTLTTLGYGDVTPRSTFGLLATSFESVLGLVWLALLASVFIKKVIR